MSLHKNKDYLNEDTLKSYMGAGEIFYLIQDVAYRIFNLTGNDNKNQNWLAAKYQIDKYKEILFEMSIENEASLKKYLKEKSYEKNGSMKDNWFQTKKELVDKITQDYKPLRKVY